MFYYLEGKVAHVEPYLAVIDCGGVGYACRTTNHTIRQLKKGEVKRLYTYLNVGDGILSSTASPPSRSSIASSCSSAFPAWGRRRRSPSSPSAHRSI